MANVVVRPIILKCRACSDETGRAPRYELVFVPPLPEAYRLYLCWDCLAALRATIDDRLTRAERS